MARTAKRCVDYITISSENHNPALWNWLHAKTNHLLFFMRLTNLLTQDRGVISLTDEGWKKLLDTEVEDIVLEQGEAKQMIRDLIKLGFLDRRSYYAGVIWSRDFADKACIHISSRESRKIWRRRPTADDIKNGKPDPTPKEPKQPKPRKKSTDGAVDDMLAYLQNRNAPEETPLYTRPDKADIRQAKELTITDAYIISRRITVYKKGEYEVAAKDADDYQQMLVAVGGDETKLQQYAEEIYKYCIRSKRKQNYINPKAEGWDGHEMLYYIQNWENYKKSYRQTLPKWINETETNNSPEEGEIVMKQETVFSANEEGREEEKIMNNNDLLVGTEPMFSPEVPESMSWDAYAELYGEQTEPHEMTDEMSEAEAERYMQALTDDSNILDCEAEQEKAEQDEILYREYCESVLQEMAG